MERLYRSALFVYRQIGARRSEAECLNILSRLRLTSNHDEIPYDPVSAAEQLQAAQILESIGLNDYASIADASIDELIAAAYGMREYRSEHRRL
jgi:hypothetical protein